MNSSPQLTEERIRRTFLSRKPSAYGYSVAGSVILITAVMTLIYWTTSFGKNFEAVPAKVFGEKEYWRAFTAICVHADIRHFLSNAYMLAILSYLVFSYFGFWIHPFLTFIFSGFVNLLSLATYPAGTSLIGASGWVYLLAGFWLTMFVLIERQYKMSKRLVRAVGVGLIILFPTSFEPSVSYRTHSIGFVCGVVFAVIYFFFRREEMRAAEVVELALVEEIHFTDIY